MIFYHYVFMVLKGSGIKGIAGEINQLVSNTVEPLEFHLKKLIVLILTTIWK